LVVLTFFLDASIAGDHPGFSHGVNLVLFVSNALLVFSLCRRIAEKMGREAPVSLAFFAALLYIIHPAMVEATAWVSGRFDLMFTFFTLGAARIYLGETKLPVKIAGVCLLMFLSLLCKETGAMFLLAMPCLWMATRVSSEKKIWRENRGFFLGILLVFLFYFFLVSQNATTGKYVEYVSAGARPSWIFLFLEALKFYLVQVFFPVYTMGSMHPVGELSLSGALGNMAMLLFFLWFCLRARSRALWCFLAGLAYLLPVLHIVPLQISGNLGHDRFLTAPLAFWAMALPLARHDFSFPFLHRVRASTRFSPGQILGGLVAAWMLSLFLKTCFLLPFWKNEFLLFSRNYALYPDNVYARQLYFATALAAGHPEIVEEEARKILEAPGSKGLDIGSQHYYGVALLRGKDPQALDCLKGLIDGLQNFHIHELPDSLARRNRMLVTLSETVASVYRHYAQAVLYFERDPQKALEMNEIGQWYARADFYESMEIQEGKYMHIAYLYTLGRFEEGDGLFLSLPSREKELAQQQEKETLSYHCRDAVPEYCEEMQARGLMNPP
jgi:hypothetical protein